MRLCSIFLAAATILSVGIVSAVAEEPADEETRRELTYISGSPAAVKGGSVFSRYFHQSGNSILASTLPRFSTETDIGNLQVYDFSVPFDNIITETIGYTGRIAAQNESDLPEANAEASDETPVLDNAAYASILVFEKKVFKNGLNRPQVMSGGLYSSELKDEEEMLFSHLSTPLTLLLITIAFCIIMVVSTTVGIKLKE